MGPTTESDTVVETCRTSKLACARTVPDNFWCGTSCSGAAASSAAALLALSKVRTEKKTPPSGRCPAYSLGSLPSCPYRPRHSTSVPVFGRIAPIRGACKVLITLGGSLETPPLTHTPSYRLHGWLPALCPPSCPPACPPCEMSISWSLSLLTFAHFCFCAFPRKFHSRGRDRKVGLLVFHRARRSKGPRSML